MVSKKDLLLQVHGNTNAFLNGRSSLSNFMVNDSFIQIGNIFSMISSTKFPWVSALAEVLSLESMGAVLLRRSD